LDYYIAIIAGKNGKMRIKLRTLAKIAILFAVFMTLQDMFTTYKVVSESGIGFEENKFLVVFMSRFGIFEGLLILKFLMIPLILAFYFIFENFMPTDLVTATVFFGLGIGHLTTLTNWYFLL
jgi:hypothetical protein